MSGGTVLLILTQVASRGFTFIGNQAVLRYSSPTLLGIAVQLELVSVTILYFARESLRVALQRQPRSEISPVSSGTKNKSHEGKSSRLQGAINISYLAIALGLAIGAVSFTYYRIYAPREVTTSPNFAAAYICYILATFYELASEPAFVVIQQQGLFGARAKAETQAAFAKCIVACAIAAYEWYNQNMASTLPFAAGQLAYGAVLSLRYYWAAGKATKATGDSIILARLPAQPGSEKTVLFNTIPLPLFRLSLTFYAQSTFKLLLTQGDALLLSLVAPLADQGAFALASNYSGLLARLVFQPVEESSRNIFGALLNSLEPTSSNESRNSKAGETSNSSSRKTVSLFRSNVARALKRLSRTVHIYTLLTLPLLVFGPPLLPAIAPIILPRQWRSSATTSLLQSYVYYLPFLALNGVLDAFITSTATPRQLHGQSLAMVGFTAIYGVGCWVFLKKWEMGPEGLVWAGMVAMVSRVIWGAGWVTLWIGKNCNPRHNEKTATTESSNLTPPAQRQQVTPPISTDLTLTTPTQFWRYSLPSLMSLVTTSANFFLLRTSLSRNTPPIDPVRYPGLSQPKHELDPRFLDLTLPGMKWQLLHLGFALLWVTTGLLHGEFGFLKELVDETPLTQKLLRKLTKGSSDQRKEQEKKDL